jgi:SulP family sulfate permease
MGVALTILFLAPYAEYIPRAALAGVLLLTATRMVDLSSLKYYWRATRFDALILTATALSAVFISIEFCILIGVFLSFTFYVPRAAKITMSELTVTSRRVIREVQPNDYRCPLLRVYNLEGELFFGSSPDFERLLESIEADLPDTLRVIIFRVKRIRNPDAVCTQILQDFVERLQERNIVVMLSGVRPDLLKILENVRLDRVIGPENLFCEGAEIWASTLKAMREAYALIGDNRCEQCPNRNNMVGPPTDWSYMI